MIKIADFGISNAMEFGDVLEDITDQHLAQSRRHMKTTAGGRGSGKFDLSSTDEFVPLGKGASSSVDASSWGQKPAAAGTEAS